ncbi:MAG: hypothetical protein IPJ77_00670 [Planctomycetes bacterium]|nr:hypothetical protein [Planctomycetota bacterium]
MSARRAALSVLVTSLTLALAASPGARAQAPAPAPDVRTVPAVARIPAHVVDGRLVVFAQVSAGKRIPANLFVELEAPVGLALHGRAVRGLEVESEDGTVHPVTLHLPDLDVPIDAIGEGDDGAYEQFTKWNSKELGDNALVGTLGARILSKYHVALDLAAGFLELSAPRAPLAALPDRGGASAPNASAGNGEPAAAPNAFELRPTFQDDVAWFTLAFGDHRAAPIGLGTASYDTLVDAALCEELGRPAGDLGPVQLGPVDLARYVAFRPEPAARLGGARPDGAFGWIGLNLLAHFRVELDRVNRVARFTPTRAPKFPEADLDFFAARASGDPDELERWLAKYPKERLAQEASGALFSRQLARNAPTEAMQRALKLVSAAFPEDLRATGALALLDRLAGAGRDDVLLDAAELGLAGGRTDRYPDAVHKLHAKIGHLLMEKGRGEEAWKHLLSAAFGLAEDGPLNLDLARYYESQGRWERAFSRYLQALMDAESGAAALAGLERVQPKVPDAESVSVESVERLLEGRLVSFATASRYRPADGLVPTRVALLELVCNAHDEGEIGVALARDAANDHFQRAHLVQVAYHVGDGEFEPLWNPTSDALARAVSGGQLAHVLDGKTELPPRGLVRHKEQIFDAVKGAVTARLSEPSEYAIELEATVDGAAIRGEARVKGPEGVESSVQLLLVERGVVYPGKSKVVIQRNVARAALTAWAAGEEWAPVDGEQRLPFERALADVERENAAFLAERRPPGENAATIGVRLDPRQLSVLAIVRDAKTREVLQAAWLDPKLAPELESGAEPADASTTEAPK